MRKVPRLRCSGVISSSTGGQGLDLGCFDGDNVFDGVVLGWLVSVRGVGLLSKGEVVGLFVGGRVPRRVGGGGVGFP